MPMMVQRAIRPLSIVAALALIPSLVMAQAAVPEPAPMPEPEVELTPDATVDRLDTLYETLATIEVEADAEPVVNEIRALWARSGSASMDLLLTRAKGAMAEEDYERATAHIRALNRLAPDFAEGWNAAATLHFLQQDYWRAVEDIETTLQLQPRHFSALTGLALILEQVGQPAAALGAWREVNRLYPGLDNARDAIDRLAPEVDGKKI